MEAMMDAPESQAIFDFSKKLPPSFKERKERGTGRKHNPETQLYKPWDKPLWPAISCFCLSWHLCSLKGESHKQGCTEQAFALHASWELGGPRMAEAHGYPFRSPMDNCAFKPKKKKKEQTE